MRSYSWDEYYEKYYDWADSTKVKNLSYLNSLGSADEVAEIILDLAYDNEAAANRLFKKAVEEKIKFSAEDLMNFSICVDEKALNESALISASSFKSEDLEELSEILDDETILSICKDRKFPLPEELRYLSEDDEDFPQDDFEIEEPHKRLGFFSSLLLSIGAISLYDHIKEKYFDKDDDK